MARATSLIVACGLFLAAGCGVPSDGSPRLLAEADVPFNLLAPSTTVVTSTTVPLPEPVTVFLVGAERLAAVGRQVSRPASVREALEALLTGPAEAEAAQGLRSAVNVQTRLLSVEVQEGIALVDLTGAFATVSGQEQILAVAQLVFTATAVEGVLGVRFALDGQPVEVPRSDGTLAQRPVGRADYAALAPA